MFFSDPWTNSAVFFEARGKARPRQPTLRARALQYFEDTSSFEELHNAWVRYQQNLDSIDHALPTNAREFARAPWHYDPAHHRCLHDSWVDELVIKEHEGKDSARETTIHLRLLGAYHDGYTTLKYAAVRAYDLKLVVSDSSSSGHAHNDWLIDEIRLSERNLVVHEISFASGARWLIECADIVYETSIPDVRENS